MIGGSFYVDIKYIPQFSLITFETKPSSYYSINTYY